MRPIATTLNIIGLVLDLIGVVLIWKFGLPPSVHPKGEKPYVAGEEDPTEKLKADIHHSISGFALFLIALGFLFQILGNLQPSSATSRPSGDPQVSLPSSSQSNAVETPPVRKP